jgi:hypothetical protein
LSPLLQNGGLGDEPGTPNLLSKPSLIGPAMHPWLKAILRSAAARITAPVDSMPLDADEKNRLYHFLFFQLVCIPTTLGFGLYNLWNANLLPAFLDIGLALSIGLSWNLLAKLPSHLVVYRINLLFFGGILLYMLGDGGAGGSMILWMPTFPLTAFFLLGSAEGLVWTGALFSGAAGLLWIAPRWLPVHPYESQFSLRFAASFLVVSLFAYWFEQLRQHYKERMEAEQRRLLDERAALQEALSKVRQLSGMLPICAACKKVRDDQGYWTQIEAYIRDHSDAEFSHSLCPDCGDRLYPGIYIRPEGPA